MSCATTSQEMADLRAQLEQERLARVQAEARLEGFREAVGLFLAARPAEAPAHPCHALSRAPQRDSVTPSVTAGDGEARKRDLARARKQAERSRKRSVTGQRDSVTASVTQEEEKKNIHTLPPPSPGKTTRGTLALVTVAARDAQRDRPRTHRTPATLPPEVQALRTAWNELAAPHGFPAWERTSAALLRDALAALERRPLEEWRRFFALVPRSPVCRGELRRGQRADLVWLLAGRTGDGYEPAEKLLGGSWSVDPEPTASPPEDEPATSRAADEVAALPGDTPAASAWREMLEALLAEGGREYAVGWLVKLRAREVCDGELVLVAPDRFYVNWVSDHYGPLLRRMGGLQGYSGVRFTSPDGEGAP